MNNENTGVICPIRSALRLLDFFPSLKCYLDRHILPILLQRYFNSSLTLSTLVISKCNFSSFVVTIDFFFFFFCCSDCSLSIFFGETGHQPNFVKHIFITFPIILSIKLLPSQSLYFRSIACNSIFYCFIVFIFIMLLFLHVVS